jgi:UDP-N-acetylmuramate--alanine ligase
MLAGTRSIHFVGVGGIGMSSVAELLAASGYEISGSDATASDITRRLATRLGVRVYEGHAADHVGAVDLVVVSSAVRSTNPEVVEARRRGIPVIRRGELLAELMRGRVAIAVTGAHGKTTTTAMIALLLERAGLDPTVVLGGWLGAFGSNARLGHGNYMVAEADESDRSFLLLSPSTAVITNIDREHMETYGSFEELRQAFVEFANQVPSDGTVIACADDPEVAGILPRVTRRAVTYGVTTAGADIIGTDVEIGSFGARCRVHHRGQVLGALQLRVPGRHNLQNALAAVAVAWQMGIPFDVVRGMLADFQGVERRFQRYPEVAGVLVVDDYGHHPREIAAVIDAAKMTLGRRLVVAFQPHRFSRTHRLIAEFGPAFRGVDVVVLTDIYGAGEDPIDGVTVDALATAMRPWVPSIQIARRLSDVVPAILEVVRRGDVVITLGAGSIGTVAKALVVELQQQGVRH